MPAVLTERRCSVCSSALLPDDPPTTAVAVCGACAAVPVCDGCGLPAPDPHHTVDDGVRCADCATGWHECEACDLYAADGADTATGGIVCAGCEPDYSTCDQCLLPARELREVDNGAWVCDDCAGDFHSCDICDDLTTSYDYCNHCVPQRRHLHDYYYKPAPVFHGDEQPYLGLELEIETDGYGFDDCVDLANARLGSLGYLKQDGSICCGFELVTHPMSYRYAIERFPWDLLPELASRGAHADGDVGIHVHVSRAGFASPTHVYRWMKFVYRNERHATALARRCSDQWASFAPDARAGIGDLAKGHPQRGLGNLGRFQAINTLPEHTFEVRIFASSLDPQQVQAALAFVAASVAYTRTLTSGDIARRRGWEWTAFVTWLRGRPEYAPLLAELEDLACAS
ncbi:amidoligase family protein [Nocardia mexicana]|uniref:Amidoligase enzyme n=1 Tax=Nocardia mexicana TaxID=279262 RepID=A0A370GTQ9_9NOCA|nr:amidoligase family protein [Nocardia mexicana]RDI45303.1 hypothetical protein DFR68_11373 [Nocardia mexicana]